MGRACSTCLVIALIAFNVLFLLIGAAILCFAIYCYVDATIQSAISQSGYGDKVQNLLYGLIGLGSLTIIVSIFGCCGAYHESACLLGTYFTCLVIMFGVELAVGALCLVFRNETETRINKALENVIMSFSDTSIPGNNGMTSSYRDLIQRVIQCCGIYGVDDYPGPNIPASCCIPGRAGCPSKSAAFTVGCKQVTNELVRQKFLTALALIMSVPLVKVFGLMCAILLCCVARRRDEIQYTEVHVEA
ncbi:cd9 antigen [Clonorchis sinensis]|uniref:Tetraspanin n=1 Tax=Clonorchis sinensis TaxID=79923 RepID=A0A419PKF3_CLOSI|nr:cd9 antigen [Clonorchis sinensis]